MRRVDVIAEREDRIRFQPLLWILGDVRGAQHASFGFGEMHDMTLPAARRNRMHFVCHLFSILMLSALASNAAAACRVPDSASLRTAWQAFRAASLLGKPDQIQQFYKFPLVLIAPMDGERPKKLGRNAFLKHYAHLFIKDPAGNDNELYVSLKKTTGNEYISPVEFSAERCVLTRAIRIADYNFLFDQDRGWVIKSLYYMDLSFMEAVGTGKLVR